MRVVFLLIALLCSCVALALIIDGEDPNTHLLLAIIMTLAYDHFD